MAILSTRLLSLHVIESTDRFSKITECQVHRLERNAYNFVSGQFGMESSKNDQICVQSIDGALYFFNDDDVLFKIQLPNFLVPGPMLYSKNTDSVIIANSNLEVESYNFNSMKAFTNNDLEQQKQI